MIEILVYKSDEEAKKQLEKYGEDNRKAFEEFTKSQGDDPSEILKRQTYFFVAELASFVDDEYESFYFESVAFPFVGHTGVYNNDISSLVQGVKKAVKNQTPKKIKPVLYTVEDHNIKNKEMKKNGVLQMFVGSYLEERGLTEQERQEFVRLYEEK